MSQGFGTPPQTAQSGSDYAGNADLYVQETRPTEGDRPWLWYEIDGTGTPTGEVEAYSPDPSQVAAIPVFTVDPVISGSSPYYVGSTLTCNGGTVTGHPTPTKTYQWKKDGVAISGPSETASTYVTRTGDATHAITCDVAAANATGSDTATSNTLTPIALTAPGQVTGLGATAGDTSVALAWTAPASNGGSAITTYLVEYRTPSGSGSYTTFAHGASTTPSITVTGLTNASAYDFRVSAVNAIGTGTASATATATPSAGGPFNPDTGVTSGTLKGWYDPSALTDANNTPVTTQLVNLSGAGAWNFTLDPTGGDATSPLVKTGILNGLRVIRCDGVKDSLQALAGANKLATNKATVFIVGCRRAIVAGGGLLDLFDSGSSDDFSSVTQAVVGFESGDGSIQGGYRGGGAIGSIAHPGTDVPFIYTTWFDGTNHKSERSPGSVTGTVVDASGASSFAVDTLYIGRRYGASSWHGDYGEMLVYSGELSAPDRAAVQAYLQAKWGISA